MSQIEFQVLTWILALVVCGLVTSWLVLVLQAFFHDKRMGFACAFGGAAAALAMAVSETFSHLLLWLLLVANLALIAWFVTRQIRQAKVYIPAAVLLVSLVGALWVWWRLDQVGLLPTS